MTGFRRRIWPLGERLFWARTCPLLTVGLSAWSLACVLRFDAGHGGLGWAVGYLVAAAVTLGVGIACQSREDRDG